MKTKIFVYLGIIFFICVVGWSVSRNIATSKTEFSLSLKGSWKYQPELSDFPLEKIRKLYAENNDSLNGQQAEISALAVFLFPPEELFFEVQKKEINLTEIFKDLRQLRNLILDEKIHSLPQNLTYTVQEKDQSLLIKIKSPKNNQLTETYQLIGADKLQIVLQFTDSTKKNVVKLQRVYKRTTITQSLPISDQSFD